MLVELHLMPAAGVRFDPGARLHWTPGFVPLDSVTLDNATGAPITIPMGSRSWAGTAPPGSASHASSRTQVIRRRGCAGSRTRTREWSRPARARARRTTSFFTLNGVEPGTYALVLPVRRGSDDYPEGVPTEAAVAIVTITTNP